MKSKLFFLGAAGMLFLQTGFGQTRPNILIILADDAGNADFGFQGCKDLPTPNIDAIAKDGVIFRDAHVSSTVSAPSRAGLMTGRYQQRFGFECNDGKDYPGLNTSETFIPGDLKKAGYATAAFGKWHLGEKETQHPNHRGFDYFYGFIAGSRSYFYQPGKDDKPGNTHQILENDKPVRFDGYLTDVLAEKAVSFIHSNRNNPFFIYWAPNAVHTPMEATSEDLQRFSGHPRQTLAAMTYALDRGVGRIVSELKASGLYNNTLIFFLSDNGGAHNNQSSNLPLKGFKGNEYEGGHRVPFVVSWPARIHGDRHFDGLLSSLDIFPSCLEAAGKVAHAGKPLDGVSLIPYLTGASKGSPHEQLYWRKDQDASARLGDYKLIRVNKLGFRMYNLNDNLQETEDLSVKQPEKFEEMKRNMQKWESHLMKPLWTEGAVWDTITLMIHDDLFHNRDVRVKEPQQLKKFNK